MGSGLSGIIYLVRNVVNHKVYVGQTTRTLEARRIEHLEDAKKGKPSHLCASIRKYGVDSFSWSVLDYGVVDERLDEREKYWIEFFKATSDSFGYNETVGGGGCSPSEATRKKMSESHRGEKNSMYGVRRFGTASPRYGKKGLHHTEETKAIISKKMSGRIIQESTKQKHREYRHNDESREKIKLAALDRERRRRECKISAPTFQK